MTVRGSQEEHRQGGWEASGEVVLQLELRPGHMRRGARGCQAGTALGGGRWERIPERQ